MRWLLLALLVACHEDPVIVPVDAAASIDAQGDAQGDASQHCIDGWCDMANCYQPANCCGKWACPVFTEPPPELRCPTQLPDAGCDAR